MLAQLPLQTGQTGFHSTMNKGSISEYEAARGSFGLWRTDRRSDTMFRFLSETSESVQQLRFRPEASLRKLTFLSLKKISDVQRKSGRISFYRGVDCLRRADVFKRLVASNSPKPKHDVTRTKRETVWKSNLSLLSRTRDNKSRTSSSNRRPETNWFTASLEIFLISKQTKRNLKWNNLKEALSTASAPTDQTVWQQRPSLFDYPWKNQTHENLKCEITSSF